MKSRRLIGIARPRGQRGGRGRRDDRWGGGIGRSAGGRGIIDARVDLELRRIIKKYLIYTVERFQKGRSRDAPTHEPRRFCP